MKKDLKGLNLAKATEFAVCMLLVLDALYVAGAASGSKSDMEKWWRPLMDTIPQNTVGTRKPLTKEIQENAEVLEQVLKMIEIYRSGQRPPARDLVRLKQRVLCVYPLPRFLDKRWRPWRADDKEWHDSN